MTASAPIVGTLRSIPDAASAPPSAGGAPAHANFRSVLEQHQSSREHATDTGRITPQKKQKDSATASSTLPAKPALNPAGNPMLPQSVTPPGEPPRVILPFTASINLRQDTTASPDDASTLDSTTATDPTPQSSGTASETATAFLTPVIFRSTFDLSSAPLVSDSNSPSISAATQPKTHAKGQAKLSKDSAPSQDTAADPSPRTTTNVPVPIAFTNTVEPPLPARPPAGIPATRQSAPAIQNSSTASPQDPATAAANDSTTAMPPVIDHAEDTTAAPPSGSLAFAARLTPTEETPASAPDLNRPADSQPRPQPTLQTPVVARQIISEADVQPDTHNGESGSPSPDQEQMGERFAKFETLLPQTHAAAPADQLAAVPASHAAATTPQSVAARMDQVPEASPAPSSGNHDITIRIPDATTDQSTAVRFVERAGEVHVSVRTSDSEMAQTLRGGLNDLVTRFEDSGIRAQVWQPGSDASTSQNNSQQPFADSDGSNGRQYSSGSNSEQESKQPNKPRWVEELEGSIGAQNSKETPQLWQA